MRLAAQVVGDDVRPGGAPGQPEVDGAVEASRPQKRRVEVVLAVRRPDHQDVGRDHHGLAQAHSLGQVVVDGVDPGVAGPPAARGTLEGLQLDQELVHHTGDALAGAVALPTTRPTDGVDLLNEADGAPFGAGVLSQPLEEGADLSVRLPEVHRLERRGGHEQERHLRLLGHRLGHERLARSRRALEEHPATGRTAHGVAERPVREEEVHGPHDFGLDPVDAHHVVEPHLDLTGADQLVGGAAGSEEGSEHHDGEKRDDDEHGDIAVERRREGDGREEPVSCGQTEDHPRQYQAQHDEEAPETGLPAAITGP